MPSTDPPTETTREALKAAAARINSGRPVTSADATLLARSLLGMAADAGMTVGDMTDDLRCRLARAVLTRGAEQAPLDDFAKSILAKCRSAVRNHDGYPYGAWSTGEQIAVALVLQNHTWLRENGYTMASAARDVAGRMLSAPPDMQAWVRRIRTEMAGDQ